MRSTRDIFSPSTRKVVAIAVVVLLCATTVIAATYAWGLLISALDGFSSRSLNGSILLQKYERIFPGRATVNPVSGAEFRLFHVSQEGERTPVGGFYTTDDTGCIKVESLDRGSYVFVETHTPPGYSFDQDASTGTVISEYPFTLPDSGGSSHSKLVVYNQKIRAPLTVTKTVENEDGSALTSFQKRKAFTFTVTFTDEGAYPLEIVDATSSRNPTLKSNPEATIQNGGTFTLRDGWYARINDLPVDVSYHIDEAPETGYVVTTENNSGNLLDKGTTAAFVSTRPAGYFGSLTLLNRVGGVGSSSRDRFAFSITLDTKEVETFRFVRNQAVIEETVDNGAVFTMRKNDTLVFKNLPIGAKYEIQEIGLDKTNYVSNKSHVTGIVRDKESDPIEIQNMIPPVTGNPHTLNITKTVVNQDGSVPTDTQIAKEFALKVTFSNMPGVLPQALEYSLNNDTRKTFPPDGRFLVKHGDTLAIVGIPGGARYKVVQENYQAEGYYPWISAYEGTVLSPLVPITLPLVDEQTSSASTTIEVTKAIVGEGSDPLYPFEFLLRTDGARETSFTLIDGETKSLEVPLGSHYDIAEVNPRSDGYRLVSVVNGQGTATSVPMEATFTNQCDLVPQVTIEAQTTWVAPAGAVLPESIEIKLMYGAITIGQKKVTAADDWRCSFEVRKYDENNNEIPYTIATSSLVQYVAEIEGPSLVGQSLNCFDIINTYISPATVDTPYVTSTVAPASAPTQRFVFTLKSINGAPLPAGSTGDMCTTSIQDRGTNQFGLITFIQPGIYEYRIRELSGSVAGFSYDQNAYNLKYEISLESTKTGYYLMPRATLINANERTIVESAYFTNTYHEGGVPPVSADGQIDENPLPPKKAESTADIAFWLVWVIIAAGVVVFVRQVWRKPRKG